MSHEPTEVTLTDHNVRSIVNQILEGVIDAGAYALVDMKKRQEFNDVADDLIWQILVSEKRQNDLAITGGPWTKHGHAVYGVTVIGSTPPGAARCGGPGLCGQCSTDAEFLRADARTP